MRRAEGVGRAEACRYCDYAIPSTLARCPGCSRSRRRRPLRARTRPAAMDAPSARVPDRLLSPRGGAGTTRSRPHPEASRAHAAPGESYRRPAPYRSLLSLAVPLRSVLAIAAVAAGAVAAIHALRLAIAFAVSPWPAERPDDLWDSAGTAATAVAAASVAVIVLTGALFITWGLRAYRNLPGLGIGDRRYWTVWLVAGWFIPGANLVVPRLLMGDVWRASSPSLPVHPGPGWQRRPVGDVVNRWWVLWLTAPAVAVVVAGLVTQTPSDLTEIKLWEAAGVVAGLALAGSATAARQMVGIVTVAQARRAEMVAWADEPVWTWTQSRRDQKLTTL